MSSLLVMAAWQMIWTDHKMVNQWSEILRCEQDLDQDLVNKERAFFSRFPQPNDKHLDFVADTVHFAEHEGVHFYQLEVLGQKSCEGHKLQSTVARRLLSNHPNGSLFNRAIKLRDSTWVHIELHRDEREPNRLAIEVLNYETKALLHTLFVASSASDVGANLWLAIDSSQSGYADRIYVGDSRSLWGLDLCGRPTGWALQEAPLYTAPQGWRMSKPTVTLESQGGGLRLSYWIKNENHAELVALVDSNPVCVDKRRPDPISATQKLFELSSPVSEILLRQNYVAFHTNMAIYVLNPEGFVVEECLFGNLLMSKEQLESSEVRVQQLGNTFTYEVLSNGTKVAATKVLFDSKKLGRRTYNHNNIKAK